MEDPVDPLAEVSSNYGLSGLNDTHLNLPLEPYEMDLLLGIRAGPDGRQYGADVAGTPSSPCGDGI